MKKSIVILSALVLFAGVSFGQDKAPAAAGKGDAKKGEKVENKKSDKKDAKKADKKADASKTDKK